MCILVIIVGPALAGIMVGKVGIFNPKLKGKWKELNEKLND